MPTKTNLPLKEIGGLLDKKLKPVSTRLGKIETSLEKVETRIGKVVGQVENRLDRIEEKLKLQGYTLEAHTESLVNIENDVRILPDLMTRTLENSEKLKNHEERIERLESPTKF